MTRSEHPEDVRIFDFPCLTEEREPRSSILFARFLRIGLAIEPPPTFPFLESQCQRADLARIFILPEKQHRLQGLALRAAWAAYIGGRPNSVKCEIDRNSAFL